MNTLREAAQQALEALAAMTTARCGGDDGMDISPINAAYDKAESAITALKAALSQQAEPVDTDCHTQGICQRSGYGIPKP